ncbi:hypothetical protein B9Z19DRAFT_1137470 [Tuber borchii]|uniref:Uncharacterized protein n=1 Tax=Tuber borchii TaxID=42251 RepID=A0A2T6ZAG5_TUBBO|nr:hypothetical protein B9Z19DRAFT_1137470 [Tuber borchii]
MAGPLHEAAGKVFGTRLDIKIGSMGLVGDFGRMDSTRYRGRSSAKEADLSWKPCKIRQNPRDWPTLIVETGVSQSHGCLVNKAAWWLMNSKGEIKDVLLIEANKAKKRIHMELWQTGSPQTRHDLRDRAPRPDLHLPKLENEFDIIGHSAPGASLTIPFKHLFLRDPVQDDQSESTSTSSDLPSSSISPPLSGDSSGDQSDGPSPSHSPSPAAESSSDPSDGSSASGSPAPSADLPSSPPSLPPPQPSLLATPLMGPLPPALPLPQLTSLPPPSPFSRVPPPPSLKAAMRPAMQEADIVFTQEELEEYAICVWQCA